VLVEQITARETAAGAVDEANAAIGASVCTGEPSAATAAVLLSVQAALNDVAAVLDGRREAPAGVERHRTELDHALAGRTGQGPAAGSLAARHSLAAGLLRLARTVTQRAARTVRTVGDRELADLVDYLTLLPRLLDLVAEDLDNEEERSIPVGMCIQA
jgi:cob(I)alamin adenosyltransferase